MRTKTATVFNQKLAGRFQATQSNTALSDSSDASDSENESSDNSMKKMSLQGNSTIVQDIEVIAPSTGRIKKKHQQFLTEKKNTLQEKKKVAQTRTKTTSVFDQQWAGRFQATQSKTALSDGSCDASDSENDISDKNVVKMSVPGYSEKKYNLDETLLRETNNEESIDNNPNEPAQSGFSLCEVCASMEGRNFYILILVINLNKNEQ